ncbi:transcriptional repressor LexA [Caldicellulosiruptor acetigenus]|uniref:transcriptional repressor LexA n=1 Tax=Caldicellulosiruptor acetigenus TaxID=301953 RepID=UPI000492C591|nr:transcriptional repressor LexA [Caldicellulosiruptor acetigenus]WAM36267.1 transcriptional repressor LexA [Caldicellulosiruptor acetigenus]
MNLNIEQKKLSQAKPNGHMLVKGVAGSGKTTVAIYRVVYLLNEYCFAPDDKILMVTFNKTLVNYLKYLYNKLEDAYISFDALVNDNKDKVKIASIDSIIYGFFQEYKEYSGEKLEIVNNKATKYNFLNQAIVKIKEKYPKVQYIDLSFANFLLDEIEWIKSCNIRELEEYQSTDRIGRTVQNQKDIPQKIAKNSETRKAIFELMQLYTSLLKENGLVDFKDMALIVLDYLKANEHKITKYTHIIIDESQDLTKVQLEILKLLYNSEKSYSSIMFIADTAQSIYTHSWLVRGRSFASIGFDMTGKSYTLSKNYRTTVQIANLAYSLIEKTPEIIEDENFVKPALIDKQGPLPVLKIFQTEEQEAEFVYNEIVNNLAFEFQLKDIAVICKNRKYLESFYNYVSSKGLKAIFLNSDSGENFEEEGIRLITMHSIKGLEFKVVFIIGLNSNIIPYSSCEDNEVAKLQETTDKKLFYVGMTRANERLYLCCSRKPSKFLSELNTKLLRIDSKCNLRSFYKLRIDDYRYINKIRDIYCKEEEVRQWLINELIETYKYPEELIDVEYRINVFSKPAFVDVVVFRYDSNKEKVPFIIFEVKPYLSGIGQGAEQLKSYLNVVPRCSFGVVTDGNSILIFDSRFEIVDDFPHFDISMLPSQIEEYEVVDFRRSKTYRLRKLVDTGHIDLVQDGHLIEIKSEDVLKINLYEKVAAGTPVETSDEAIGKVALPTSIISDPERYFAIKVKGDSMVEANIKDGDIAIVQKCNTAENRDIVIAWLDGEITVKRFCKMGSTVLLIPENSKYEPINIKEGELRIVGKVVGVMRKKR